MTNTKFILLCIFCSIYISCKKSNNFYVGKWKVTMVVEKDSVIPLQNNWIHLKPNGTFESYDGGSKKKEDGKWVYETQNKTLFVDSYGKENDSNWNLEFKNDTLYFHSINDDLYLVSIKEK